MNILCNLFRGRAEAAAHIKGGEKHPDIRGTVAFYNRGNRNAVNRHMKHGNKNRLRKTFKTPEDASAMSGVLVSPTLRNMAASKL